MPDSERTPQPWDQHLGTETGQRVAWALLALALAAGLALFVHLAAAAVAFPFPLDYGEGPILDQAVRLARGENIYRADLSRPPFTVANYPPLFPALQAPFVRLAGPALWYGRALSLLGVLLAAAAVGGTVRALTGDRAAGLVAALLLPTVPYVLTWAPLDRVDGLALGLSWAGLWLLVRRPLRPPSPGALAAAAALLVAAIATRQTYAFAAPLAACVYLRSEDGPSGGRRAFLFCAGVAVASLGLFLLGDRLTGGGLTLHLVRANVNPYSLGIVRVQALELLVWMPGLLLAGVLAVRSWRRPEGRLLVPYLAGAALSLLGIGKTGSNVNYLFELSAGLAAAAGCCLAWVRPSPRWRTAVLLALAAQTAALVVLAAREHTPPRFARIAQQAELARLYELVRAEPGPVLADEQLALLPLAGKPVLFQPFEMRHLIDAGLWRQRRVTDALRHQEVALVLLYRLPDGGSIFRVRWTPQALHALRTRYRQVDEIAGNLVYRPRPASPGRAGPDRNPSAGDQEKSAR